MVECARVLSWVEQIDRWSLSRTDMPSSGSCSMSQVRPAGVDGQAGPHHWLLHRSLFCRARHRGQATACTQHRMELLQAERTSAGSLGLKRTVVCSSPEGILMQAVGTCRGDGSMV